MRTGSWRRHQRTRSNQDCNSSPPGPLPCSHPGSCMGLSTASSFDNACLKRQAHNQVSDQRTPLQKVQLKEKYARPLLRPALPTSFAANGSRILVLKPRYRLFLNALTQQHAFLQAPGVGTCYRSYQSVNSVYLIKEAEVLAGRVVAGRARAKAGADGGRAPPSTGILPPGPISPNRGVRRGPQRLGWSVTLRSKTANPQ
jgi:hypothetical protein